MGLRDWFTSRSKEERARMQKAYEEKVLPLGAGQKTAALRVLRQLLGPKKADSELIYWFVTAKESYLDDKPLPEIQRYLMRQAGLRDEAARLVLALILLDSRAASLETYPIPADVLAFDPSQFENLP